MDQTTRPDRFVVIDNASTDGSRQIAVDMGVEVVDANNRFKYVTGLNTALNLCRDRLFFMQNDVTLDRDCLKHMNSDVPAHDFIAQPIIYERNGNIDNSGMDIYWPGYGIRRSKKWWNGSRYEDCGLATSICFITDRSSIYKNGKYDEIFSPAYYEDLDYALRSKKNGTKNILIPAAKAFHWGNHTFSSTYKKQQISNICRVNRKKFIKKNYSGMDKFCRLAVTAILDIMKKSFDVIADRWVAANNRH